MKGGIFALSEMFVKILSIASVALVLLAIFMALNQYHIIYLENKVDRETLAAGNAVLSSCIAEYRDGHSVKALLSESKIVSYIAANPSKDKNLDCLPYERGIYIEVYDGNDLLYGLGDSTVCETTDPCIKKDATTFTTFPAALNRSGTVIPVTVKVYLGSEPVQEPLALTCDERCEIRYGSKSVGTCRSSCQSDENPTGEIGCSSGTCCCLKVIPSCDEQCKILFGKESTGTCVFGGTNNNDGTSTIPFKLSLWFSTSDFNTPEKTQEILQFIGDGKFDFIVLTAAKMKADNTLGYDYDNLNNIITAVKSEYPQVEVYADIYSFAGASVSSGSHDKATEPGLDIPDWSTAALRQTAINSIVSFWNQFSGKFDGIIDDTEVYYGTNENHYNHFTEAATVLEPMGVPYYPWLYYGNLPFIGSKHAAVGLYGGHSYYEDGWKSALDRVQQDSDSTLYYQPKDGYMIWIIVEHYLDYPTVSEQLEFFDEQIAKNGLSYYDKMESFGMWWYRELTEEDKQAWISWANSKKTGGGGTGSSSNSFNIMWIWNNEMYVGRFVNIPEGMDNALNKIKNYGFSAIAVPIGGWGTNGDLNWQAYGQEDLATIVSHAHSVGLKVYASAFSGGENVPNLGNSVTVSHMLQELQNEVLTTQVDGYIDDLEMEYPEGGTEADYVNWANSVADTCRATGKLGGAYLMTPDYPYETTRLPMILPYLDVDIAIYATDNPEYLDIMSEIGTSPWMPHVLTDFSSNHEAPLGDRLDFWDSYLSANYPANFKGFSFWEYEGTTSDEWNDWVNFDWKNTGGTTSSGGTSGSQSSSNRFNAIWFNGGSTITDRDLDFLASMNIFNIYWQKAYLDSSGVHSYSASNSEIAQVIDYVHSYDSRFRVLAWLGVRQEIYGFADLSTPEKRASVLASEIAYVQDCHFDGLATDLETGTVDWTTGTDSQDFIDFWNAETEEMHKLGKISAPFVFSGKGLWTGNFDNWLPYIKQLKVDYVALAIGSQGECTSYDPEQHDTREKCEAAEYYWDPLYHTDPNYNHIGFADTLKAWIDNCPSPLAPVMLCGDATGDFIGNYTRFFNEYGQSPKVAGWSLYDYVPNLPGSPRTNQIEYYGSGGPDCPFFDWGWDMWSDWTPKDGSSEPQATCSGDDIGMAWCSSGTCCCTGTSTNPFGNYDGNEEPDLPPSTLPPVTQPSGSVVYVDSILGSSGGDGSSGSPFKTIQQGLSAVVSRGDVGTIEVRDGIYQGPMTISDIANPLLIRAAPGATPIIDCSKKITGFTQYSGSIYKVTPPEPVAALFYNGDFIQRSRYPDSGWLTVAADASDKYTIPISSTDANFLASKGVSNTLATVRVVDFWADTVNVRTLGSSTLNLITEPPLTRARECYRRFLDPACYLEYAASQGWGYYLENEVWMMNQGSWAYDFDANVLYVWLPDGQNPNNVDLYYSNPDDCVVVNNAQGLTVQGLTIRNSGGSGVIANTQGAVGSRWNNMKMENIKFRGYELRAPFIIDESSVSNTGQDAVVCWNDGKADIESSSFTDIGMALGPRRSSAAIFQDSYTATNSVIRNNYMARLAYIGTLSGSGTTIEGNTIEDFCLLFDDCAAIYSWGYNSDHLIRNNIVRRATANMEGKPSNRGAYPVCGVYLDDQSDSMTVENNFISDTDFGIFIHNSRDSTFRNNKIVGFSRAGIYLAGGTVKKQWFYNPSSGAMEEQVFDGQSAMANDIIEGNIIADTKGNPLIRHTTYGSYGQLASSYIGNGNYYWNFFSPTILYSEVTGQNYNYAEFQAMNLDSNPHHPTAGPFSDSPENHIQGIANPEYSDTQTFPCPNGICNGWIDKTGAQTTFPVTLASRESKLIWNDGSGTGTTPSQPPSGATEFLIRDEIHTFTDADCGWHFWDDTISRYPDNWFSPVNFWDGTIYYHYQVISQGNPAEDTNFGIQFMFWNNLAESPNKEELWDYPKYVSGGAGSVAEASTILHDFVQWEKGIDMHYAYNLLRLGISVHDVYRISGITGDTTISCPAWGYGNEPWASRSLWFPMQIRLTIVAVAQGATFSGWNNWLPATPVDGYS